MWSIATVALKLALALFQHMQRQGLINEGKRQQFAKDMAAVMHATNLAEDVRSELEALSDDELRAMLRNQ